MSERKFISRRELITAFAASSETAVRAEKSVLERNGAPARAFSLMEFLHDFERKYRLSSEEFSEDYNKARFEPNLAKIGERDLVLWGGLVSVANQRGLMRESPSSGYRQAI